jgi:hypothetical protein
MLLLQGPGKGIRCVFLVICCGNPHRSVRARVDIRRLLVFCQEMNDSVLEHSPTLVIGISEPGGRTLFRLRARAAQGGASGTAIIHLLCVG